MGKIYLKDQKLVIIKKHTGFLNQTSMIFIHSVPGKLHYHPSKVLYIY